MTNVYVNGEVASRVTTTEDTRSRPCTAAATPEWVAGQGDASGTPCPEPVLTNGRIVGPRSGIELAPLFDPDARADESPYSDQLRTWATEYLCRPHVNLGRSGPVCPFTSRSISRGLFWAGFVGGHDVDRTRMTDIVEDFSEIFPALPPATGSDSTLKAVLAVFPDISEYDLIDEVQQIGKSRFVEEGLMLGQFYPGCAVSGLRNKNFPALDAPLPMLVVRHMVGSDLPFLVTRLEWVSAYLKKFAPAIPVAIRSSIAQRIVSPG